MTNINKNFVINSDKEDNRYKIKVCNVDLRERLDKTSVSSIALEIWGQIESLKEPLLR